MARGVKRRLLTAIVTGRHQIRRDRTGILAKRVERLGVDSQPGCPRDKKKKRKVYPVPDQAAVWSVYLSNYKVTCGEDKEGGENGKTWHSGPHSERGEERTRVGSAQGTCCECEKKAYKRSRGSSQAA
jgi:hypothetical protein